MSSRVDRALAEYAAHGWPARPCPGGVALQASQFDLVEIDSPVGAIIHHRLLTRVPTATIRPPWWSMLLGPASVADRMRWVFVFAPGFLDPDQVARDGGRLHHGPDAWVPAPPGRTPDGLTVGWVVPPSHAHWHPYRPDGVFDSLGWLRGHLPRVTRSVRATP
ncbi:hypothetical protein [Salinispora arenicola]|uniref:hypothetical protein n=1 Tax=Salinispora arenicola TaxID=168697 RepID=UPI0016929E02|nr:hypothetical protein [Salinispora arenicola]NIL64293.1 hypothetical protein [Salinispora arenicola]